MANLSSPNAVDGLPPAYLLEPLPNGVDYQYLLERMLGEVMQLMEAQQPPKNAVGEPPAYLLVPPLPHFPLRNRRRTRN